jgi:hypothetical protein
MEVYGDVHTKLTALVNLPCYCTLAGSPNHTWWLLVQLRQPALPTFMLFKASKRQATERFDLPSSL